MQCRAGLSPAVAAVGPDAWRMRGHFGPPEWPAADWWQTFGSTQLDDLMTQTRTANDDIAAAIARVRQADAQIRIAGAPLLPTLGVGGGRVPAAYLHQPGSSPGSAI